MSDNVQLFLEFSDSRDRQVAQNYLDAHHNNLELAVQDYFDSGANTTKHTGYVNYKPSNQIQALPPAYFDRNHDDGLFQGQIPQTRPSSRNQDWSEMAFAPQETGVMQGPLQQQDFELERAIADSLKVPDALADPANPHERSKSFGPSFLRPLPGDKPCEFLPSFLTILYSIPACFVELIAPGEYLQNYGHEKDWWKGSSVELSRITFDGKDVSDSKVNLEILYETQRLMVFLFKTLRAYGSAEALTKVGSVIKDSEPLISNFESPQMVRFMLEWEMARTALTESEPRLETLFRSTRAGDEDEDLLNSVFTLPPSLPPTSKSLYEALDKLIWDDSNKKLPSLFQQPAPILSIICNAATDKPLSVPLILHVDRYLDQNRTMVDEVRSQLRGVEAELANIEAHAAHITNFAQQKSTGIVSGSASALLGTAIDYLKDTVDHLTKEHTRDESSMDIDSPADTADSKMMARISKVLAQLQEINRRIQARLDVLTTQRKASERRLADLQDLSKFPLTHPPYHLRGVAILPTPISSHIYLKHPHLTSNTLEWRRMTFDPSPGNIARLASDAIEESAVQLAAGERKHETLLVYAREDLLHHSNFQDGTFAINEALLAFAEKDDRLFELEVEEWDAANTWDASAPMPVLEGQSPPTYQEGGSSSYDWNADGARYDKQIMEFPRCESDSGVMDVDVDLGIDVESPGTLVDDGEGAWRKEKRKSESPAPADGDGAPSPGKKTRVEFEGDELGYGAG